MNIKILIKSAVNLGSDDSGKFRRGLSKWLGRKSQKVESFVPFGTFGKAPKGNAQLAFAKQGQESNTTVLEGDPENRIIKDTKEGEYGTGNPKEGSYTYYKDGGDIELKTGEASLILHKNGAIEIKGINGNELLDVIDEWMTNMINAKIITGIGLQPFDPVTITNLTATQVKLNELKDGS